MFLHTIDQQITSSKENLQELSDSCMSTHALFPSFQSKLFPQVYP